ncbi:MAG TPA: fibro-slime domain-containing protein [Fibrobacteria bacterium]|nr:fibro-slime domain-containing protein [Fibrobacteria bacterium]
MGMRQFVRYGMAAWVLAASWPSAAMAQEQVVLRGVVRDFAELVYRRTTGGHPDFNPTIGTQGREELGCFDRPSAERGAVESTLGTDPVNPDGVAGLLPLDRDNRGPKLKAGFDQPPNCFRSRFADWYTTRSPDVNRAFFLDLPFQKQGVNYVYDNRDFFPVDDANRSNLKPQAPGVTTTFGHRQPDTVVDGNRLSAHNFGFTFEFHARFTYKRGSGQVFTFLGDDDVWVFINDNLVIDLGGLHPAQSQTVDLDNLGLVDGQSYPLDFFFAERRVTASRLTITTSLELSTPDRPDPPVVVGAVKVLEGAYHDRNGDGIADSATLVLDSAPAKDPSLLELRLGGEVERGGWTITRLSETTYSVRSGKASGFFSKPVTGWDESDPANQGRALKDAAAGLSEASFPMKDRIGAVIAKAVKVMEDTTLSAAPSGSLLLTFTEPVAVGTAAVLKFRDRQGREVPVDLSRLEPVDAAGGRALTWKFTVAPGTPNDPGEGWEVAVSGTAKVRDAAGNTVHADNPFKAIEVKKPEIHIGGIRAEKAVNVIPIDPGTKVAKPFVLLTSDKVTEGFKDYVPLRSDEAEDWVRRIDGGGNPGVVVFDFEVSHPVEIELTVFDTFGQFVNKTRGAITREDLLQSGRLSRVPDSRAFLVRYAWYPISHDGALVSTGAYILKVRFNYGIDPRDNVSKGSRERILTFGFLRPSEVLGLD